jgi:nucleotide-binding universal stress UspA family protein
LVGFLKRCQAQLHAGDSLPGFRDSQSWYKAWLRQNSLELYLLYVIEFSNAIKFGIRRGYFTDADSKMQTWAKVQLENMTPAQWIKDDSVRRLVEEGPVSDKIAESAATHDVNLVILGAHGYGPVEKHFVGRNTDSVLTKLAEPMLIVKI